MNATGMFTFGRLVAGIVVAAWATVASAQQQLDREAVDGLLGQARQAIESGDLATADQLISRCEAAGVRYPLLHFGDTPTTLRRELTRARSRQGDAMSGGDPFALAAGNLPDLSSVATADTATPYPTTTPVAAALAAPPQAGGAPRTLPGVGGRQRHRRSNRRPHTCSKAAKRWLLAT